MWKKCLMLSLVLTAIFTVKSLATQTYNYTNPFNTNISTIYQTYFSQLTYDFFNNNNLEQYDFFTCNWKNGNYGATYTDTLYILYKNDTTKEIIYKPVFYNYRTCNRLYYVNDNNYYLIDNQFYINSGNSSYGHCVYFLDFNNDNTVKNICYLDLCGGNGDDSYSNNAERIIFNNNGDIWACGLSNFYIYNLSSQTITYKKYADSSVQYVCVNAIEELSNYNINDYLIIPSYYTICENNTPVTFSNSMLNNNFTDIHTAFCNGTWGSSSNIPFYEDYTESKIIFNIDVGFIVDSTENIILHVEDSNLRNIFKFNFQLPKHKEDSVYYAFMNNYTRNSYNSVTANFTVYEMWTPPEYTGSFEKYMIYDEEGKYFTFVNGLFVNAYTGSCDSGGNFNFETTEININNTIVNDYIATITEYQMFNLENDDNFVRPSTTVLGIGVNSLQSLGRHLINNLFSGVIGRIGLKPSQEITASSLKKLLYYSNYIIYNGTEFDNTNYYRLNDCCFATGNIYAYENTYSSKVFESDFYNLIRNTIVRDSSKFKLTDGEYLITKVDGQNVSSLLPSGTDTTYLNSPIFRNTDSINGGYLLSNVEDIINGQKPINYNVEYSPIYNTYNENYIQNYNDNLSPENEDYINSTDSDSKLIQKFISYLKSIDDKLDNLKINVSNTTNSFTTSFQNFYTIDKLALKDTTDSFIDTFNDSMGIIADIPTMALYFLGRFSNLNNGAITLVIPRLEIFDAILLEQTTINFTDLINSNQTFIYLHNIALVCTDVILLSILLQLAKNAFEEVKR